MLNSRNIDDLRPDVAANCRRLLQLCRGAGLDPVGINQTVRDQAFQDDAIRRGAAPPGSVPTFHAAGVGLAFDFHRNITGRAFDNNDRFFHRVGEIAVSMGFTWGGGWRSPDLPHVQWDDGGRFRDADILAGRLPPAMPLYSPPSAWAAEAWAWAVTAGITDGTRPSDPCTREQVVTMLHRYANVGGANP
jgi:hypothetical protein